MTRTSSSGCSAGIAGPQRSSLPLTENVGHHALIYIKGYGIVSGLRAGDALIAATAVENNLSLASGNARHFRALHDLVLKVFKP